VSFRFVPPQDGQPGYVYDGDKRVTAQFLTRAQAKHRALFWKRKQELELLERLRSEIRG
jgi:hypothetical protein